MRGLTPRPETVWVEWGHQQRTLGASWGTALLWGLWGVFSAQGKNPASWLGPWCRAGCGAGLRRCFGRTREVPGAGVTVGGQEGNKPRHMEGNKGLRKPGETSQPLRGPSPNQRRSWVEWSQPDGSAHFPERETEDSLRDRHPVGTEEPEASLCEWGAWASWTHLGSMWGGAHPCWPAP